MKRNRNNGYSTTLAKEYISSDASLTSLSTKPEAQYKWVNGKRTDSIGAYQAWFSQEGLGAFKVKFKKEPQLPPYLSTVQLDNLEACEVGNNVYFRAIGIREV